MKSPIAIITFILMAMSCHTVKKSPQDAPSQMPPMAEGGGNDFIMEKIGRGVEFYAIGNEPGWSLEMDQENGLRFMTQDGIVFNTPPVGGVKGQTPAMTRYHAIVESGELDITLTEQECTDNMSGEKFPYKVQVRLKRGMDKSFKTYDGCGKRIFDQRIHDIWALQEVNGKVVTITEGRSERPYLEFHTNDNRVLGKTGCNDLSGGAEIRGNKIIFDNIAVTQKACQDANYESAFLKAMAPGMVRYKINAGRLYLYREGKEVMVFRKVD